MPKIASLGRYAGAVEGMNYLDLSVIRPHHDKQSAIVLTAHVLPMGCWDLVV